MSLIPNIPLPPDFLLFGGGWFFLLLITRDLLASSVVVGVIYALFRRPDLLDILSTRT